MPVRCLKCLLFQMMRSPETRDISYMFREAVLLDLFSNCVTSIIFLIRAVYTLSRIGR